MEKVVYCIFDNMVFPLKFYETLHKRSDPQTVCHQKNLLCRENCQNFPFQTVKILHFQTVKIFPSKLSKFFIFKLSKFLFSKLSKFPFPNCQNFLFRTVKISFSKPRGVKLSILPLYEILK